MSSFWGKKKTTIIQIEERKAEFEMMSQRQLLEANAGFQYYQKLDQADQTPENLEKASLELCEVLAKFCVGVEGMSDKPTADDFMDLEPADIQEIFKTISGQKKMNPEVSK